MTKAEERKAAYRAQRTAERAAQHAEYRDRVRLDRWARCYDETEGRESLAESYGAEGRAE